VSVHAAHPTPPLPRIHVPDESNEEPQPAHSTKWELDHSLQSPHVLTALSVAALLIAIFAWRHWVDSSDNPAPSVTSIVLDTLIEPATPESDLPYITAVPLVPVSDTTGLTARPARSKTAKDERVTLGDSPLLESHGAAAVEQKQRR
jgi:hypothetical protein